MTETCDRHPTARAQARIILPSGGIFHHRIRGEHMSDATFQAVHDAIAAHVADVNEGPAEYLTEWLIIASTATHTAGRTGYYYRDSDLPFHHAIGLLHYAQGVLSDYETDD